MNLKKYFKEQESVKVKVEAYLESSWGSTMGLFCENSWRLHGVIQAKIEVGHRVWDSWVWNPKLPNSKNIYDTNK